MKIKSPHLIFVGLLATVTALPATTIIDGFGTLTLDTDRFIDFTDTDGNWHNQDGAIGSADAFQGVMTATTLTVDTDPFADNSRLYETPTVKIINNTASGSTISFSFDYNVTAGSPSIYFHLKGVDETGASPVWTQDLAGRGGAAFHRDEDYDSAYNTQTYNLFTGLDTVSGSNNGDNVWAYNGGNTNLTGTGTVSGMIDLSGYTSGGRTGDLSDYEYLIVAFGFDFDEAGMIEVSKVRVSIPEPSFAGLLGGLLALSSVMLRRRLA